MRQLILVLLAILCDVASAQGLPSIEEVRKVTDEAMKLVGAGDIEGGMRAFKSRTTFPDAEFEGMVSQFKPQIPALSNRFGQSIGYEFLEEKHLGESLARLTYLNKFEKHAMRWFFYLYKQKDGWVINTFRFDDKWHELF